MVILIKLDLLTTKTSVLTVIDKNMTTKTKLLKEYNIHRRQINVPAESGKNCCSYFQVPTYVEVQKTEKPSGEQRSANIKGENLGKKVCSQTLRLCGGENAPSPGPPEPRGPRGPRGHRPP